MVPSHFPDRISCVLIFLNRAQKRDNLSHHFIIFSIQLTFSYWADNETDGLDTLRVASLLFCYS